LDAPDDDLRDAREGSSEALGRVLQRCRAFLLRVAEQELGDDLRAKGGASDIVQDTFLEAQRDFGGFGGRSEAELLAWLRRMLLNNLANFARHYRGTGKRRLDLEEALDTPPGAGAPRDLAADVGTPSALLMGQEQAAQVARAMERLPEQYRKVLTMRYQQERTFEEIGQEMGMTVSAARKMWLRAVLALQQELPP
jgi:RNA polymerase sigma-70 factor (ECF subfamily)